ncbi:hypothetical protein [Amycolatopsis saalfeldensis]|uniref:Uncharacterized protein n=1 Tax=Amycolatopsis saalfeldensis TaxID=394193 RepID=A0A1H8YQS2_9PSEU|nr:hypothetical protein [Amycolatopsis saalfeldensis]SEP53708.1 hypothetical protein SAMN04489732_13010 [Amycolatopsis saalfeldensis]
MIEHRQRDVYDRLDDDLTQEILKNKGLRESHATNPDYRRLFDRRVNALTGTLLRFQENVPRLREIDDELKQARDDFADARRDEASVGVGRLFLLGLLTLAGLTLALAGLFGGWVWPITLIGALAAGGGGLRLYVRIQFKRDSADDRDDAAGDVQRLLAEKRQLLPQLQQEAQEAPLPVASDGTVPLFARQDTGDAEDTVLAAQR